MKKFKTRVQLAQRVASFLADGPAFVGLKSATVTAILLHGAMPEQLNKLYANIVDLEGEAEE